MLVPYGRPSSWADGHAVKIGEDSIDFDITLKSVDRRRNRAVLLVRHLPPAKPSLNLPAEWMKTPVKDTPNNWVEVSTTKDGKIHAAVGKETFDVTLNVDLKTGEIIDASLENPVDVQERVCSDDTLANPGPPTTYRIHRRIEIRLESRRS